MNNTFEKITDILMESFATQEGEFLVENMYIKCTNCGQIKPIKEISSIKIQGYPLGELIDNKIILKEKFGLWCKKCVGEES